MGYRRSGDTLQLIYQNHRPRPAHRLDCPGRYYDRLLQMKYAASGTNVPSTQLAACNFIREGHYHRHVRRMRQIYQRNMEIYTCWLREFSPAASASPGQRRLYAVGRAAGAGRYGLRRQAAVSAEDPVAPGSLFSASGKYRNCLGSTAPCRRSRSIKR